LLGCKKKNRQQKRLRVGSYSGGPSVHQKPINGSVFRWGAGPSLGGDSIQGSKRATSSKNMSFCVYILRCADNSYCTGHTDNLEERIAKHQAGEIEGYTSTRLLVELLFSEEFPTREEALACERQIKGWSRKKKEALTRGDWVEVSRLAHRGHQFDKTRRRLRESQSLS